MNSIFIQQGKAVKWFDNAEVIADDVVELAKEYSESGAKGKSSVCAGNRSG